jgi:hypothetical protein
MVKRCFPHLTTLFTFSFLSLRAGPLASTVFVCFPHLSPWLIEHNSGVGGMDTKAGWDSLMLDISNVLGWTVERV